MLSLLFFTFLSLNYVYGDGPLFMDLNDPQGSVTKSKVNLKNIECASFSGFLPLKEDNSKALFFWYFPSMVDPENAPVIIWLQGWQTPGLYGLFMENGPYSVDSFDFLHKRTYAWNRFAHVVYIDPVVGTGFSFTNNSDYPTNSTEVASDLFSAISDLIEFYPELQLNNIYVGGESYAGKYVPLIALLMHQDYRFQLKGIFLGNPFVDPLTQVNYSGYLYQHGLIDYDQAQYFKTEEQAIAQFINASNYKQAAQKLGDLIFLPNGKTYFNNVTGFNQYYNFINTKVQKEFWKVFTGLKVTRQGIHVGNLKFNDGVEAFSHLLLDVPQSSKPYLEEVLKNYKVLVYAGQDDIICASPMMESMLDSLSWEGSNGFTNASRKIWNDGTDVAGYIREYSNLSTVMVRNAGHMAPMDQPRWIYLLVKNFVTNSPLGAINE